MLVAVENWEINRVSSYDFLSSCPRETGEIVSPAKDLGMIYDIFGRVSGLDNWRFKRVSLKESLLFNEEVKSMDIDGSIIYEIL